MFKRIDVQTAADQQKSSADVQTIDVRRPDEYEQVHANGFTLIPLADVEAEGFFAGCTLDPRKPLLIICRSGARSAKAAQLFVEHGFSDVSNVEGGTIAWVEANLPNSAS